MNRVELAGVLPRDPELRMLPSGTAVCEFTCGVKEGLYSREKGEYVRTHWIRCVSWGDAAEYVAETFRRGDEVYVLGQLTQDEVETKEGKKERKTKVRCLWVRGTRRRAPGAEDMVDPDAAAEPPF